MKNLYWSPFFRLAWAVLYSFIGVLMVSGSDPAPGDLDLSFDPGTAITDSVELVAGQSDGKWIVGEFMTINGTAHHSIRVFIPDGFVDEEV